MTSERAPQQTPAVRQLDQLGLGTAPDPIRVRVCEADVDLLLSSKAVRSFEEPLGWLLSARPKQTSRGREVRCYHARVCRKESDMEDAWPRLRIASALNESANWL